MREVRRLFSAARVTIGLCMLPMAFPPAVAEADRGGQGPPEWAIPREGAPQPDPPPADRRISLPGSELELTQKQIDNPFDTPVWFPEDHDPMPRIVRHGNEPDNWACAMCHLASGTGHPQSAKLAGLDADYMLRQLKAFATGDRESYLGAFIDNLHAIESDEDAKQAAEWFASLRPASAVDVVESETAPETTFYGTSFMRVVAKGDGGQVGEEPLAGRIIEVPKDYAQVKARSPRGRFVAYVPEGSVEKGREIVMQGTTGVAPCVTCHGPELDGTGLGPALAGAYPTYIVRQLYDFRTGKRGGLADQTGFMGTTSRSLSPEDIVNVAAYLGSLDPG